VVYANAGHFTRVGKQCWLVSIGYIRRFESWSVISWLMFNDRSCAFPFSIMSYHRTAYRAT
jgi:hypothetical protein